MKNVRALEVRENEYIRCTAVVTRLRDLSVVLLLDLIAEKMKPLLESKTIAVSNYAKRYLANRI